MSKIGTIGPKLRLVDSQVSSSIRSPIVKLKALNTVHAKTILSTHTLFVSRDKGAVIVQVRQFHLRRDLVDEEPYQAPQRKN